MIPLGMSLRRSSQVHENTANGLPARLVLDLFTLTFVVYADFIHSSE